MTVEDPGPLTLAGFHIRLDVNLLEDGDPIVVPRTWRERLFSRPWRPWQATRACVPKVPYRGVLQLGDWTLVMHPQTYRRLRASLDP